MERAASLGESIREFHIENAILPTESAQSQIEQCFGTPTSAANVQDRIVLLEI